VPVLLLLPAGPLLAYEAQPKPQAIPPFHGEPTLELASPHLDIPASSTRRWVTEPDADLMSLVRHAMQLDHRLENHRVAQEIAWLQRHPDFIDRLAPRLQRFGPLIFQELERRNMPGELLFLAVIESALDPFAFSPGGAAGLWQFMPATGKRFGLKVDWWVDERRDPLLATGAALDYLQLLHRRFGSWELAIAAYNAGEGRISRAVRRADSKDFFQLRVPRETAGYVPRLYAFAAVFNTPWKYDLYLPHMTAKPSLRKVDTHTQMDLSRAASALGVSVETLYDWNPALNQWATHPRGPHRLLVDKQSINPQLSMDRIPPSERLAWGRHVVRRGETLSEIAEQYDTTTGHLIQANKLASHVIRTNTALLIPKGTSDAAQALPTRRRGTSNKRYRVVPGDTLSEIAERFDVSLRSLIRLNQTGPRETLRVGQQLIIPLPRQSATGDIVKEIAYRVRQGDSLSGIAARFNVTTRAILGWNELDLAHYLQPGQRLRLYVDLTVAN